MAINTRINVGLESFDGQKYLHFSWGVPLIREDLSILCSQILHMSDTLLLGTTNQYFYRICNVLWCFYPSSVQEANKHQVIQKLPDLDSEVETYDIKIAVNNKGKHDIRLKFVDRKPVIVAVKQDEEKLLITDILCLHRYTHTHTYACIHPHAWHAHTHTHTHTRA